jgi:hypothetical protein
MVKPMHTFLLRTIAMAAVVMAIALPNPGFAQQRPLQTEDPETIGADRILLEGGVEFGTEQTNAATGVKGDVTHIGTFGVSIGISPYAEVQVDGGVLQRLEVSERLIGSPLFAKVPLVAGDHSSGFGDLIVATKIRFTSETETRPALGARFGTKLPTADSAKGVGLGTTDFFAAFLVAKTVQSVRTVGNVGLVALGNPVDAQDPATALTFGVSVARAVTNAFEVVGEMNGRLTPFEKIVPKGLESRGVLRFAGRYTYAMLRLDAGLLIGITDRDPGFGISAGATYVLTR